MKELPTHGTGSELLTPADTADYTKLVPTPGCGGTPSIEGFGPDYGVVANAEVQVKASPSGLHDWDSKIDVQVLAVYGIETAVLEGAERRETLLSECIGGK